MQQYDFQGVKENVAHSPVRVRSFPVGTGIRTETDCSLKVVT